MSQTIKNYFENTGNPPPPETAILSYQLGILVSGANELFRNLQSKSLISAHIRSQTTRDSDGKVWDFS